MMIKRIEGCTREVGKSQNYLGLPLRDDLVELPDGSIVPRMSSAWEPTPKELDQLSKGAPIILCILGTVPPPVYICVGDVPETTDGT